MENAGRGAAEEILCRFAGCLRAPLVLGGVGQNGGDGWVVARQLLAHGVQPTVALWGDESAMRGDAVDNWRRLGQLGVVRHAYGPDDIDALLREVAKASLIIDAVFGIGLSRTVDAPTARLFEIVSAAEAPCVALDVPSGVDADNGQVRGSAVRADLTLTFAAAKRGLYQYPAAERAGEIVVVSLGVPLPKASGLAPTTWLWSVADARELLPQRAADEHKGSAGHLLVIAGSSGAVGRPSHHGAAKLAGLGGLRAGAGVVTVATRDAASTVWSATPELMVATLSESVPAALEQVSLLCLGKRAAVLGPGLGTDVVGGELARRLAVDLPVSTVLDADALTALAAAGGLESLRDAQARRVLTPHPGEAAKLLGHSVAFVQGDRFGAARQMAERSGQIVVLKGAGTLIAEPGGEVRVCGGSNPALASAGTGDVLAGIIGAQLLRVGPFEAASLGVMLHALAAGVVASGDRGYLAHEVANAVPEAIRRCQKSSGRRTTGRSNDSDATFKWRPQGTWWGGGAAERSLLLI